MFSEKIDEIMRQYNIKNVELAKAAGVSPSFISKLRRGLTAPSAQSGINRELFYALDQLLSDNQIMEIMHKYMLSWNCESFCAWICTEESRSLSKFSICLCRLMEFFDIPNNVLAKALNFDASLISKYRMGKRTPSMENGVLTDIVDYFATLAIDRNQEKELLQAIGSRDMEKGPKEIAASILAWMMSDEIDTQLLDKIFYMMEEQRYFAPDFKRVSELVQSMELPEQQKVKGQGNVGLRELVTLFLTLCSKSKEKLKLRLFSNQDMTWMLEDPQFFAMWRALMLTVLECGHKVVIIHNMQRNDRELFSALEGWLPLHLSGNIESYYYTVTGSKAFANTIFDCGKFAVYGSSILNLETEADFYFTKDKDTLKKLEEAFEDLMKNSQKLLEAFPIRSMEDTGRFTGIGSEKPEHSVYLMQHNIPIWHMQEELLLEILRDNQCSEGEIAFVLEYVQIRKAFYQRLLDKNQVFEYFYVPEQFAEGKEILDFLNIYDFKPIYYRKEQYERHLRNVTEVLQEYKNYHITLLNEPMHDRIKLFQFESGSIVAIKNKYPVSAIQYKNEIILQKFHNYMFSKRKSAINSIDNYDAVRRRCLFQ